MTKLITADIAKKIQLLRGQVEPEDLDLCIAYHIYGQRKKEKHFAEKTRPEILETDLSQFLLK